MTISSVPGYVWPLTLKCKNCGIGFDVQMPTDMRRHVQYGYDHKDGISIPYVKRKYVTASCPCCGEVRELQENQVPEIFGKAIPAAEGENPIYG